MRIIDGDTRSRSGGKSADERARTADRLGLHDVEIEEIEKGRREVER